MKNQSIQKPNTGAGKGPMVRQGLDIKKYRQNKADIDFSKLPKHPADKIVKHKHTTTYIY